MLALPLTPAELDAFEDALRASVRDVRFKAQLLTRNGVPLPISFDITEGEVQYDASNPRQQVTRTAYLTIADPKRLYSVDLSDGSNRSLWFNKQVAITYGVYVASLSKWVDVPVFQGPIYTSTRHGHLVDLDCQGKEALHLPPAYFAKTTSARKHTKKHRVIKQVLEDRGETEFDLEPTNKRLHRDRVFFIGTVPWKACVNFADSFDRQLFYDGRGRVRLRRWPDSPSWKFTSASDTAMIVGDPEQSVTREGVINMVIVRGEKTAKREVTTETKLAAKASAGATSIKVKDNESKFANGSKIIIGGGGGNPESRIVSSRSGTTINFTDKALARNHAKGAPVKVRTMETRTKRIIGKAKLDRNHLLSEDYLGTAFIKFVDRPSISNQSAADDKADAILNRIRDGLGDDIGFSFLPVPHLEEGDRVLIEALGRSIRIKTMTIPLGVDGLATINHKGQIKVPKKGKKRG